MLAPLVVTKYTMPPARTRLVYRPQLVERLLAGLDGRLTLIAAPAGFGKSTLAAQLARASGRPTAWLSLDGGDNDPQTWGAYLAAAIGHAGFPTVRMPEIPPPKALIATLINEWAVAERPLLLVFDDYHVIESAEIHEAVSFLLDRLPPTVHVVISSRARPPLPLARLRARGQLSELTAGELRFTAAEAAAFLHDIMGLDLPGPGVTTLFARTEGWVAGLQLGALSLRPAADWAEALRSFSGQDPHLLDYLVDEVLASQPPALQAFLCQTAILERLTGSLCEAVTGQPDGHQTLQTLEQANLFLFPLDPERRWYRYHPLFAEFLRARLRDQAGAEGVAELYRRAAHWFYEQGQVETAVDHLLTAGAFDQASAWLEELFGAVGSLGSTVTVRRWVQKLPRQVLRGRPRVALMAAWALIDTGEVQEEPAFAMALEYLDFAARGLRQLDPDSADAKEARGVLAAVRIALAPWAPPRQAAAGIKEDAYRAVQLAEQARQLLAAESRFWRSVVSNSLGSVLYRASHFAGAAQAFGEAARLGARSGSLSAALAAMHRQGQLLVALGRLHEARAVWREALRLAADQGGEALPTLAPAHLGLGLLHLEWNDLEAADASLSEALRRYETGAKAAPEAFLALARLCLARGEAQAARTWLDRAEETLAASPRLRAVETAAWPEGVRVLLALGDVAGARRWVDAAGVRPDPRPDLWRVTEYVALARVLAAEGEPAEAIPLLHTLCEVAASTGCRGLEAEGRLALALALHAGGDAPGARSALQAALALTAPEGYVRLYVDAGGAIPRMLAEIATDLRGGLAGDAGIRGYVERLVAILPTEAMVEPLTPRELQILQLIATGRSNQDVARELFMGVSTVKWHLINIFGKLQVKNRTEAVARARETGLL